jgi:uncharacterized protein YbjQ (UPF0145 family)
MDTAEDIYQQAYRDHYTHSDSESARVAYQRVIQEYPKSAEAGYARTQLENLERDADKLLKQRGSEQASKVLEPPARAVVVTTAPSIDGYSVIETLDIVTAECVLGVNVFRDLFAGMVTDLIGGRSKGFQQSLRSARTNCIDELRREADELGANAVIATTLNYSEISGSGKSMLFVVAVGTAVRIQKCD